MPKVFKATDKAITTGVKVFKPTSKATGTGAVIVSPEAQKQQALSSMMPQFKAGQNTIAGSIADAGARLKGFSSATEEKRYAAENPNLYSALGGAKYNPIPSKTPTILTDEGRQIIANAQKADKGDGVYAYNINSINIADRSIVNSAAQKVKANKLLELTAQEKYTLQKLAREMKEAYGETAISEYTGKENIDMFDALWWLTGAYQNTGSQSQMLYQAGKSQKLQQKRIEQAVLSSDDFAEKVRLGKNYNIPKINTPNSNGGILENFAADYSKTQEKTPLFLEKVKNSKDIYKYMTENEKGVYYYFLGSGKIDAADDYAESLKSSLESRKANFEADNNNFFSNLGDAISTGYFTGAQNIGRSISGLKAATNQTLSELDKKMFETTYDEKLWGEIQANSGDRKKITNLLLETVNSVASQVPAMVVGSATGQVGYFITMSANIVGGTTTEAINAGYEAQQGFIHGLIESALEATVEKALGGFSSLLKSGSTNTFVKSAIGAVDKAVKNKFVANLLAKTVTTLGQGGAEGVEEFLQELTGPLVRNLIYGENNKYSADTIKNAIHAFAVGALSGIFMSVPYIKSNVNETRAEITGDVINSAGGVKSVLALAEVAGNNSQLYQSIKEKVNSGIEVDSADIGYLYQESFNKFKNPNSEMMKSFAERNVDAVIAEAQKMQSTAKETTVKNAEYTKTTVNSKILDLIKKVKSGIFKANDKEFLNSPSKDVVRQITEITGIDVSGFKVAVEARQIEHILKDHGENGAADHSMSDDLDIAKMEYTLNSPDSIVLSGTTQAYVTSVNGKNKPAKTVLYEKSLGNNSYYVVQAVPDTKAKTLYIVSAFIGKEGYKKETSQTTDAKSPSATPNSENASVSSDNTVPQNGQSVNNNMSELASFMSQNPILQSSANNSLPNDENGVIINNIEKEKRFTDRQHKAAIMRYKSGEAYTINAMLREGEGLDEVSQEFVDTLDEALQDLPKYEGTVYRNVTFDDFGGKEAFDDFITQFIPDEPIVFDQFISCSTKQDGYPVEGQYKVQLIVESKNARDVDGYGNNMESEVIYPNRSAFIVDKVSYDGDFPIIYLQEMIINGYQSTEEQGDAMRKLQEPYSTHDNLQSVPTGDTVGDTIGSIRPQSTTSERQRDTLRAQRGQGAVLSAESAKQENRQIGNTQADSNSEPASFMPENGAQGGFDGETQTDATEGENKPLTQQERNLQAIIDATSGKSIPKAQKLKKEIKRYDPKTEGQKEAKRVADELGLEVVFEDTVQTRGSYKNGYIDENNVIHIDFREQQPAKFVLVHELTHYCEETGQYGKFTKALRKSKLYADWLRETTKMPNAKVEVMEARYRNAVIEQRGWENTENAVPRADREMVADFCGTKLFGVKDTTDMQTLLDGLTNTERRTVLEVLADFFERVWAKLTRNKELVKSLNFAKDLSKLERLYSQMYNEAKNNPTENGEVRDSIDSGFYDEFDSWDGIDTNKIFTIGTTSEALKSVNIKNQEIKMRSGMILQKIKKHPEISLETFRNIPELLEHPIIIQFSDAIDPKSGKSKYDSRITILGELYADMVVDGKKESKPVLVSLELLPTNQKGTKLLDISLIMSAYGHSKLQSYLRENSILYIDPNKKRTNKWLSLNRLQLPLGENRYGPVRKITYSGTKVNIENSTKETSMQSALRKAGVIDSYGNIISDKNKNDTSKNIKDSITVEFDDVDNADSEDYNYDSHYGENLRDTLQHLKPSTDREWQVFCRSFANKTNGMKKGEYRNIDIFTEKYLYLVEADGYMSGVIYSKINIDNYESRGYIYDNIRDADDSDRLYEIIGDRQGNNGDSSSSSGEETPATRISEMVSFIESHPEWFGNKRENYRDYKRRVEAERKASAFSMPETKDSITVDMESEESQTEDFPAAMRELSESFKNGELTRDEFLHLVDELYTKAGEQRGIIKQGETVTGKERFDSPAPKSVGEGKKVGRFARTIIEGGELTDEMISATKQQILSGDLSYTPSSNEKVIKLAQQRMANGNQNRDWQRTVNGDKTPSAVDIAVGELLLKQAIESKDAVRVVELTAELVEVGTRLGQAVQALSLLKRMDGISQLVYIQRCVDGLNRDLAKRFKKKFGNKIAAVEINEDLALQLARSKTEADFEISYYAIIEHIANQVPSTFLDKFNAWRYLAMLFNSTTHIRNFLGNAIFIPSVKVKNIIAAAIESIAVDTSDRTKSLAVKKEYKDFAKKDFANVKDILSEGGKMNPKTSIADNRQIFKSKALEAIRKSNFELLEKEDMIFLKYHYAQALGGYLQARKASIDNISHDMLQKARLYAMGEALKATYRDVSKVANIISQISRSNAFANIAVEGLLPFKKTPINIVKRGVEYSPLGLVKTLGKAVYDLNQGTYTATEFIDGLASSFTGAGIMVLGMILASCGVVTGGFDDDDEAWFRKLMGEQEYSVVIGNKSYTIDWLAPACIPFFMGVAIAETWDKNSSDSMWQGVAAAVGAGLEPIVNLSMLSGIQDTIASVRYADADTVIQTLLGNMIGNYFSQLLPTVGGKLANTIDDTRRTTYIDKNSDVPRWLQTAFDTVAKKTPLLSQTRQEYINAWGETEKTGNVAERFLSNFVSPGYFSETDKTEVSEELQRLAKATGNNSVYPDTALRRVKFKNYTKQLSREEYTVYATAKGQAQADYLKEAVNSKEYKKLTDEQKAKVINNLYNFANAKAKSAISYSYDELNALQDGAITKDQYKRLSEKARKTLAEEYFLSDFKKAYNIERHGGSAVDYYVRKALVD